MSGGHFDYKQHHIIDIISSIEELIRKNKTPDEYGYARNYSDAVINEFKNAIIILKKAYNYIHAIDWLVSNDDGEEELLIKIQQSDKQRIKLCK